MATIGKRKRPVIPFQMTCDATFDPPVQDPLPNTSFFMILSGRPGSGKTNMLLNLLLRKSMYSRRFDKVYIVSPSQSTMKENYFMSLPDEQKAHEWSVSFLEKMLEDIHGSHQKVLLVLDDVVNQIDNSRNERSLLKLIYNRRHLTGGDGGFVSVLMTTQVYNRIPLRIRKAATSVIQFKTTNRKEIESLYSELISGIDLREFETLLKKCFRDDHSFICVNVERGIIYCGFDYPLTIQADDISDFSSSSEESESDSDASE